MNIPVVTIIWTARQHAPVTEQKITIHTEIGALNNVKTIKRSDRTTFQAPRSSGFISKQQC